MYFPQKEGEEVYTSKLGKRSNTFNGGEVERVKTELKGRHPKSIQIFKKDGKLHPTQKPVGLCEFLIRSYTIEGDIILDNCIGSGTTAVAALKNNRKFIGFETESKYIEIANKRLDDLEIIK